jgi:hypothetical protein
VIFLEKRNELVGMAPLGFVIVFNHERLISSGRCLCVKMIENAENEDGNDGKQAEEHGGSQGDGSAHRDFLRD